MCCSSLSGILAACFCATGKDKLELDDTISGSGGMLLKSNTEGPGEEVSKNLLKHYTLM